MTGCQKKMISFKNDSRPRGMPKQVILARFAHVVGRFGPRQILENAMELSWFGTKKIVKNESKCGFARMIHSTPFGVPKQVKEAYFEAIVSHFGPL